MGISTDCADADKFLEEAAVALAQMIEEKVFELDWDFQLQRWLPQIADIAYKLRGGSHQVDVHVRQLLVAGEVDVSLVGVLNRKGVFELFREVPPGVEGVEQID